MESNTTVRGDNLVKPVDTPIGKRKFYFYSLYI